MKTLLRIRFFPLWLIGKLAAYFLLTMANADAADDPPPFNTCGTCQCIPSNNGTDPCPSGTPGVDIPQGPPWDNATISQYELLTINNPITLNCNPYNETACPIPTSPPQDEDQLALDDEAVCAIKYHEEKLSACPASYDLSTYDSKELAEADGAYVTHYGACGVCSTTQDLAAYMRYTDLTTEGQECVLKGLGDEEKGIECFMGIGYTRPCAQIWMYNGFQTQRSCLRVCTSFVLQGLPNNGPPPTCDLAECLVCDEENSGPVFTSVGGRTRRRSGMLSYIVRPCEDILVVDHVPPCEANATDGGGTATDEPTGAPDTESTPIPTGTPSAGGRVMESSGLESTVLGCFISVVGCLFFMM